MKNIFHRDNRGESSRDSSKQSNPSSQMRRNPRQLWWAGLFLSSLVAMGSTFESVRMQRLFGPANSTQKWAVGSITTVFLLTFICLTIQMIPQASRILLGTKIELFLIFILTGFTCAAVGTATNPKTGMAVNSSGGVSFGNLYYSTWISFMCAMAMLLSFMKTERGLDVPNELKARGRRFRLWVILVISTAIVMGSSASSYDARCDHLNDEGFDEPPKFCRRAAFGVSVGCIGCVTSLAIVAIRATCSKAIDDHLRNGGSGKGSANKRIFMIECVSCLILLCFYCFAVGYLTSEEGPGAPLGNLYYSTWISFGIIFFIALSSYNELQMAKKIMRNGQQQDADISDMGSNSWLGDNNTLPPPELSNQSVGNTSAMSAISSTSMGSGSVGEVQIGV